MAGSRPVSLGGRGAFDGRLVLQIVTDIVFITGLKIVNGPAQDNIHARVNIPRFGQQATPFPQSIQVGGAVCRIVAGNIRRLPVLQEHQEHDKRDDLAPHHHEFHHDEGIVAEPNAVVF